MRYAIFTLTIIISLWNSSTECAHTRVLSEKNQISAQELYDAIESNDNSEVQILLAKYPMLLFVSSKEKERPLYEAVHSFLIQYTDNNAYNDVKVIQTILDNIPADKDFTQELFRGKNPLQLIMERAYNCILKKSETTPIRKVFSSRLNLQKEIEPYGSLENMLSKYDLLDCIIQFQPLVSMLLDKGAYTVELAAQENTTIIPLSKQMLAYYKEQYDRFKEKQQHQAQQAKKLISNAYNVSGWQEVPTQEISEYLGYDTSLPEEEEKHAAVTKSKEPIKSVERTSASTSSTAP